MEVKGGMGLGPPSPPFSSSSSSLSSFAGNGSVLAFLLTNIYYIKRGVKIGSGWSEYEKFVIYRLFKKKRYKIT